MIYQLASPREKNLSTIEQILLNRGLRTESQRQEYLYNNSYINHPQTFQHMDEGIALFVKALQEQRKTLIIVDSDCDGFTSAAIMYNFIMAYFPSTDISYYLHSGKQHGLNDCIDYILQNNFKFVIAPDSGSNDFECHKTMHDNDIYFLALDHHDIEKPNTYGVVISSQDGSYSNTSLSGAGVTWQFCRYMMKMLGAEDASERYVDLAMLGNLADMMSVKSLETKNIIQLGMMNIRNPFIAGMFEKNAYSLGENPTPWGVVFYVSPFVNAISRSGTQQEKDIVFRSMLETEAYQEILSTKRGHALGDKETVLAQALRVVTNVKARQTKTQDSNMGFLEDMIVNKDMLKHKVLLFLLPPNAIDRNIAGLIANKIMAKYMRPCCILIDNGQAFEGSARGCDKAEVTDFKRIVEQAGAEWAQGHPGAFGMCLRKENVEKFIEATDMLCAFMSDEPVYTVDFIYNGFKDKEIASDIINITDYAHLWGKEMDEPLLCFEKANIYPQNVSVVGLAKNKPTLKITLDGMTLIKFGITSKQVADLTADNGGCVVVNIVGRANINEWNGVKTPQILIDDYEVVAKIKHVF